MVFPESICETSICFKTRNKDVTQGCVFGTSVVGSFEDDQVESSGFRVKSTQVRSCMPPFVCNMHQKSVECLLFPLKIWLYLIMILVQLFKKFSCEGWFDDRWLQFLCLPWCLY